ncbi:hypothetical protein J8I29_09175 [Labrys sp. LIt4]|uniref:hypothetical protein n=1 Tax=Labrys sp. LIt4 TaxID=2821355 RepID=UPI001ADF0078|nr:hypothetical protein [Labrys sp. LIt4]MBP0579477.1 hypothetical protein [Labrys sp. LIt4]
MMADATPAAPKPRPVLNFFVHLAFTIIGIGVASLTAALIYIGAMMVHSDTSLGDAGDIPTLVGFLAYMTVLLAGLPALLTRALMHLLGWRAAWPYMAAAAIVAAVSSVYLMFGTEWISNVSPELAGVASGFGLMGALCGLVFWLVAVRLPAGLALKPWWPGPRTAGD